MKKDYRKEAIDLASVGVSVIPVKSDGSKMPKIKWKEYQDRIMSNEEIDHFFEDCGGVIAITGKVSNLLCIDFDLDKQGPNDDYWGRFMGLVPNNIKKKMLVNQTRSGGYHVWLRTDYEDKSRKVTHRQLSIPELNDRYKKLIDSGANESTASAILLKKPVECIIETRSRGSYGVFHHEQYKRFFGDTLNLFNKNEVEHLLDIGYSLDFTYRKQKTFTGRIKPYKTITQFNEDATAEGVVRMIEKSGLFTFYELDSNGNYKLARVGSSSPFSAYVYGDTGVLHVFGLNPFTEHDINTLSPFEVFCSVNNFTMDEAIKIINEKR